MKKTALDYLNRAMKFATSVDAGRWELAEIAAEMRDEKIDGWAEKLACLPNVRRAPRTVREWSQTADIRHSMRRDFKLPFSFFSVASRYADRIELTTLEDALEVAESEAGITHEAFSAQLRDMVGMTPDGPDLARTLADVLRLQSKLGEVATRDYLPGDTYTGLATAHDALTLAINGLEKAMQGMEEGKSSPTPRLGGKNWQTREVSEGVIAIGGSA